MGWILCLWLVIPKANAGEDWSMVETHIQQHSASMRDACVSIRTERGGWGSGVIVSSSGLIFSAAHVFRDRGEKVTVFFKGGFAEPAVVVKHNPVHDAAVLRLQSAHGDFAPARIFCPVQSDPGGVFVAAGHASGFSVEREAPLRVGFGFVAPENGMILTTCRVTAGDSGGPLYDESGRVLGIHHSMDGKGGFATHIPIRRFVDLWPDLLPQLART